MVSLFEKKTEKWKSLQIKRNKQTNKNDEETKKKTWRKKRNKWYKKNKTERKKVWKDLVSRKVCEKYKRSKKLI